MREQIREYIIIKSSMLMWKKVKALRAGLYCHVQKVRRNDCTVLYTLIPHVDLFNTVTT